MSKKNVLVMFGGKSVEHEVSVITGLQVVENIDKNKYNVIPLFITKNGEWYSGEVLLDIKNYKNMDDLLSRAKKVYIEPVPNKPYIQFYPEKGLFKKAPEPIKIDVVFPALHGSHGEDGTMQGMFELCNIPYVGSGVLGSAVGMDKIIMKDIFKANGIPIVNYKWFLRSNYINNSSEVIEDIERNLSYPMFVKPANLGSSIGITRAKNREELINSIEIAINYDRRIIVEEAVENPMEINCSVIGFDEDYRASVLEQPISWQEFLSFEDKYLSGSKNSGMKSAARRIPAPLPDDKTKEIRDLAVKVFKVLDCSGISRIDFLVEPESMKVYVNEINTMPGSISFYLWEPTGVSFKELIDKLIYFAFERNKEHNKNMYTFDTPLLKKASSGVKGSKR
ncbi:D-alanine--D-alanine ligase [Caloramator mitchellensis]|uniref:D-alanine--D-alanine ligase n=1 Tax=Caloramator mitchellensis TaxID=908809 RepID=A0A0R3K3E6_CALMK|nr:D-alanine--D-alanine ligase family protein [Caloramator mitchellensis]KRQ87940.1 D-alanine--D-alanine ligase [Caloramator mitchellensis]